MRKGRNYPFIFLQYFSRQLKGKLLSLAGQGRHVGKISVDMYQTEPVKVLFRFTDKNM